MSMKDIRKKETAAHHEADAKLGETIAQVAAEEKGWFASLKDRLVEIGQAHTGGLVRTASAEKSTGPTMAPQMTLVARTNECGSVRNLDRVVAEQKRVAETHTRSIENAVAQARDMIAKVTSDLKMAGAQVMYIRSDISRWDDKTGEPQTGRLAFQVPFEGSSGASRTIYANVDIVAGDLLPPRYFQDGLNKRYAFDESGITELMEGMEFEILTNPHVTPDTKYRGPDMFPPSGIPSSVAGSRGGQFIHRHASGDIIRTASGEKPKRVGEGLVRAISKETMEAQAQDVHMPPTSPEEIEAAMRKKQVKQPSDAISAYPGGKEHGTGYVGENHGSDQTPAAITMSQDESGMSRAADGEMPPEGPRRPMFRRPMRGPKKPQAEKLEGIQWNEEPGEGSVKKYAGTASHGHYAAEVGENYAQIEKMGEGTKQKHDFKSPVEAQKFAQEFWGIPASAETPPEEGGGMLPTASLKKTAAGAWDACLECLKYYDIRQLNYADLIQYLKANGQESSLTYEDAAKRLMGEGIVLYRIAGTEKAAAAGVGMLIRLMALNSRRQVQADMGPEMGGTQEPGGRAGPETGTDVPPDFEISRYLEPVEYKEYDALLDKWESLWHDIQSRERQNLEQGQEAHANIDYGEVQILADQIKATQSIARERHDTEGMPAPADVSMDDQTEQPEDLDEPVSPAQEAPGQSIAPATMKPEKGRGQAAPQMGMGAVEPGMVRKAAATDDLNNRANEVNEMLPNLKDEGNAAPGTKGDGRGKNRGYPQAGGGMPELARKAVTVEMTEPVKEKMRAMQLDPNNPEHQDQFVSTVKKVQAFKKNASQSLDFPEVCKNCKWLVTPVAYSAWTEYKKNRLPTCGAPKSQAVGFEYAWFRECASYDAIAKDIPQKIESISTKSEQTDADIKKVTVPIKQKAVAEKTAGDFAAPGSVAENDVDILLEDLDSFMDAFTYKDEDPVQVGDEMLGEEAPGEEDTERQIQQQIQQARESKDPGAIRAALQEASTFLGAFSGPDEAALQARVTEALESSMPEQGMSPFEDVSVDDSDLELPPVAPDKPNTLTEQSPESMNPEATGKGEVKTAEALPSADADAVRGRDSGNGASNEVRKWCKANGHYAPAGEHHPTHDWCTLWNKAVEDLVVLPSGAGVPKSMAYQTSETGGEGGAHQFGRSPNQSG